MPVSKVLVAGMTQNGTLAQSEDEAELFLTLAQSKDEPELFLTPAQSEDEPELFLTPAQSEDEAELFLVCSPQHPLPLKVLAALLSLPLHPQAVRLC